MCSLGIWCSRFRSQNEDPARREKLTWRCIQEIIQAFFATLFQGVKLCESTSTTHTLGRHLYQISESCLGIRHSKRSPHWINIQCDWLSKSISVDLRCVGISPFTYGRDVSLGVLHSFLTRISGIFWNFHSYLGLLTRFSCQHSKSTHYSQNGLQ